MGGACRQGERVEVRPLDDEAAALALEDMVDAVLPGLDRIEGCLDSIIGAK